MMGMLRRSLFLFVLTGRLLEEGILVKCDKNFKK